jgi:hypothetical protein
MPVARQSDAVDEELVLLGAAAKNRMVLDHEARLRAPGRLGYDVGGREPRDAAADDDDVGEFAGVDRVGRQRGVDAVADAMGRVQDGLRVAV